MRSELCVPLKIGESVIGVINAESSELDAFSRADERLLDTLAGQLATAIGRVRSAEALRQRAAELEALARVSSSLRQAQNRDEMLPLLLEAALQVMQADAGSLLLLEDEVLTFVAGRGPAEALLGQSRPPCDDPLWGVARSGQPLFIEDIHQLEAFEICEILPTLMAGMRACACVPLQTAETTVGVLHLASHASRRPNEGEARLLTAIAEMAGNALHRSALHEQTLQDATELAQAYDATIEGWASALELRDQETEGHTRRVTELTLRLARDLGIEGVELEHIRRGALLHDIGKMGVPDSILLKPGPLDEGEWAIMRQHPAYAYNMLSPIEFLHPALEIPYCHHEKWDGSGYPRGLAGEEIPLAARLFAVIDVYDALTSDRPYRKAWTPEKTIDHIREQTGKHFDPQVVEAFLKLRGL